MKFSTKLQDNITGTILGLSIDEIKYKDVTIQPKDGVSYTQRQVFNIGQGKYQSVTLGKAGTQDLKAKIKLYLADPPKARSGNGFTVVQ